MWQRRALPPLLVVIACIGFLWPEGVRAQLFGVARSDDALTPGEYNVAPYEALLVLRIILARQRLEVEAKRKLKPLQQTRKMMGVPLPHKPQGPFVMSPEDTTHPSRTSIPKPAQSQQTTTVIPSPHMAKVVHQSLHSMATTERKQEA